MGDSLISHALAAAAQGRYVFPAKPGTKIPLIAWGKNATKDLDQVVAWWTKWPMANIGIACKPSGLVVLDTDRLRSDQTVPKEFADLGIQDGEDQLSYLMDRYGDDNFDWLKTETVQTPSDGLHRYFWAPPEGEEPIANSQPLFGCWKLDVRGAGGEYGGIVFAAGSRNSAGAPYRTVLEYPVASMPPWLRERCRVRPPITRTALPHTATVRQGTIPDGLLFFLAGAPQGEHAKRIYWAARQCLNMGVPEREAITALLDVALGWRETKNGWSERRVATAVRSAYSRPARSA